ncbi:MAG: restriction endonuclease subunit S [Gammaproteobacteria bacterium]|nr:restriction endonuclease subunit S [Gammaproteobacteria bacterium]
MIETTLGEITQITTGKLDANAQDLDGLYPFFTCGEDNLKINTAAFDTEAILLAGNGNFSVKYYKGKFNAYQRTYVIEPNLVYGKWLYYLIMHHIAKITSGARGSTIKYLRIGDITSCPVNLVCIAQQKRTVAKIETLFSELDNGIASLKAAKEQLKVYRQAVLKQAFEGKLTAKWRAQNADKLETPEQLLARIQTKRETRYQQQLEEWKEAVKHWETNGQQGKKPSKPKPLKDFGRLATELVIDLPKLPSSWLWEKLANLTTGVEYGTSAKSTESGLVPVIRMGNIQNGQIDWSDLVYTSDKEEIEKYLLSKNDVLFNRTNSPELVGKTAKYKAEKLAVFAGYLIRVNQIDSIALADYVNYFLNSHIARQYGNRVKTDGVNQSNINGEKLQNYPFPFCSVEEQSVIVQILDEKLSVTDSSIQDIELQLSKAETLRQSILKKAFSGQLVPQDANDEPASELLQHIRKKRGIK